MCLQVHEKRIKGENTSENFLLNFTWMSKSIHTYDEGEINAIIGDFYDCALSDAR